MSPIDIYVDSSYTPNYGGVAVCIAVSDAEFIGWSYKVLKTETSIEAENEAIQLAFNFAKEHDIQEFTVVSDCHSAAFITNRKLREQSTGDVNLTPSAGVRFIRSHMRTRTPNNICDFMAKRFLKCMLLQAQEG